MLTFNGARTAASDFGIGNLALKTKPEPTKKTLALKHFYWKKVRMGFEDLFQKS